MENLIIGNKTFHSRLFVGTGKFSSAELMGKATAASGSEAYVYRLNSVAADLGEQLLIGLHNATGLDNRGVRTNPSLYVLRRTAMPAVLMEMGYLTNTHDARLLSQDPQSFARGMYNGILTYFGLD